MRIGGPGASGPWRVEGGALALLAWGVGLLDGWIRAMGFLDRLDAWIPRVARDDGGGRCGVPSTIRDAEGKSPPH